MHGIERLGAFPTSKLPAAVQTWKAVKKQGIKVNQKQAKAGTSRLSNCRYPLASSLLMRFMEA